MVYVQDINGKPMMPTTRHGRVRRLLKDKKAVVVNLCPFTIKLIYVTSDYKQEIVLGVADRPNMLVYQQRRKAKNFTAVKLFLEMIS